MDDEGLAPTKSEDKRFTVSPRCCLGNHPVLSRGLEPRLTALKGRGFSQLIYESEVRRTGAAPALRRL